MAQTTIHYRQRKVIEADASFDSRFRPMLAVSSEMPNDPTNYAFEFKWDGVRAIFQHSATQHSIFSRNGKVITSNYPELEPLHRQLRRTQAVLDGEIIALDENNRPSFHRLQNRMHVRNPSDALVAEVPVWYVLFDCLMLRGKLLTHEPYEKRREILLDLVEPGDSWQITPSKMGTGKAMLHAAREHKLEGLIAKRLGSFYLPAQRSYDWRKIKIVHSQEFVVGGWIEQADHPGRIGSLLVGYHDDAGKLQFAGGVGTGFTDTEHARLVLMLSKIESRKNPFDERPPGQVKYVRPKTVVEVEYRRWPEGQRVQQAAYKGIRNDKKAKDVVKEHR